jgi:2-polyprenyl-3-methyl-5-hydroxy-6-metoxy-1,4-benzoquinol methylase
MSEIQHNDWTQAFFPGLYTQVLSAIDDGTAARHAQTIRRLMTLRKGARVLDCPCGMGRITRELARLGMDVVGLDFVDSYIRRARRNARKAGVEASYKVADMRRLDYDGEFDAVVNWFTSYGYFSDAENLDVLRRFHRAVKPGGKLLIETQNRSFILRNFREEMTREIGGVTVCNRNRWNEATRRIESTWTLSKGGRHETHRIVVRTFTGTELRRELRQAGFREITLHDHNPNKRFTRHSQRLIAVARREDS